MEVEVIKDKSKEKKLNFFIKSCIVVVLLALLIIALGVALALLISFAVLLISASVLDFLQDKINKSKSKTMREGNKKFVHLIVFTVRLAKQLNSQQKGWSISLIKKLYLS